MRHRKHFYMGAFAEKNECGTSMCIAGHALDLQGYSVRFVPAPEPWADDDDIDEVFYSPVGRKVDPEKAARREMGLTRDEVNKLFYDMKIRTPKQAAARIEQLIAEG